MNKIKQILANVSVIFAKKKSIWLIVFCLIITFFTASRKKDIQFQSIEIDIQSSSNQPLLSADEIYRAVNSLGQPALVNSSIESVTMKDVEVRLEDNPFIAKADAYRNLEGNLYITIKEQKPILRIISKANQSYYLTDQGHKIPTSEYHTARVPVATGNIEEPFENPDTLHTSIAQQLYTLAQFLNDHPFAQSLTGQIIVNAKHELVLITRMEEKQEILIGDANDLDIKFQKLETFYTHVLPLKGWNKYRYINLKFKDQIIAK